MPKGPGLEVNTYSTILGEDIDDDVPETPEGQKDAYEAVKKAQPERKAGDTVMLISMKWMDEWTSYCDLVSPKEPHAIKNQDLLEADGLNGSVLREGLIEDLDFVAVSPAEWDLLAKWYGGGPRIRRCIIEEEGKPVVELYPPRLEDSSHSSSQHSQQHYQYSLTGVVDSNQLTPMKRPSPNRGTESDDEKDGSIRPRPSTTTGSSWMSSPSNYNTSTTTTSVVPRGTEQSTPHGLSGLRNLGNTCFMNSALQCLSNTQHLTDYFVSGAYKKDINTVNPLGMKGELAESFGQLMQDIWSGKYSAVFPREFKSTISKFATQFSGYRQHDSQELISFLLDGLHEDVNRVLDKKYTEKPEYGDNQREIVHQIAEEAWNRHLSRNQSAIVDLFHGMMMSTVVCPDCQHTSITFDPLMYLSLPLPVTQEQIIPVTVVFADTHRKSVQYGVKVASGETVKQMKQKLGELCGVPGDTLDVGEIWSKNNYSALRDEDGVESLKDYNKYYAFEIGPETEGTVVRTVQLRAKSYGFHSADFMTRCTRMRLPEKPTVGQLYQLLTERFSTFAKSYTPAVFMETRQQPSSFSSSLPTFGQYSSQSDNLYGDNTQTTHTQQSNSGSGFVLVPSTNDSEMTEADNNTLAPNADEVMDTDNSGVVMGIPVSLSHTDSNATQIYGQHDQHDNISTGSLPSHLLAPTASSIIHDTTYAVRPVHHSVQQPVADDEMESYMTNKNMTTGAAGVEEEDTAFSQRQPSPPLIMAAASQDTDLPTVTPDPTSLSETPLPSVQRPFKLSLSGFNSCYSVYPLSDNEDEIVDLTDTYRADIVVLDYESSLAFDIDRYESVQEDATVNEQIVKPVLSLNDCLEKFMQPEVLSNEEDYWRCPRCKDLKPGTRKIDLWSLPEILVIHLKRFQFLRTGRDKIDAQVDFPIEGLDLNQVVVGPKHDDYTYDLFAVSNHYGGLGGGHYTAYAKSKTDNQWHYFDDDRVSDAQPTDAVSPAAYVLFYQRRSAMMKQEPASGITAVSDM